MSGLFKVKQDHFKYVKILCWHVWLTLNGEERKITWDLLYMMGQVSKKSREEYLKKERETTEDKFYLFILWRAKLDRILFLNLFLPFPEKLQNGFTLIKLNIGILIQP